MRLKINYQNAKFTIVIVHNKNDTFMTTVEIRNK